MTPSPSPLGAPVQAIQGQSHYLQGACVWKGAEMGQNHRWLKQVPAVVLDQTSPVAILPSPTLPRSLRKCVKSWRADPAW